jgi:hypothetical protein
VSEWRAWVKASRDLFGVGLAVYGVACWFGVVTPSTEWVAGAACMGFAWMMVDD